MDFSDLSVGLISVLTDIVWRITVSWNAGNVACKLIRFLQVVVTYSSTYVLVALSIDRYDAITHPMNFSGSWKRARLLVFLAWIISILFSVPILVFYHEKEVQGEFRLAILSEKFLQFRFCRFQGGCSVGSNLKNPGNGNFTWLWCASLCSSVRLS